MSNIAAYQSGLLGIQRGIAQLNRHTEDIASARELNSDTSSDTDRTRSLIGLKESEIQVAISAKVIKTTDETLGTLLDEFA